MNPPRFIRGCITVLVRLTALPPPAKMANLSKPMAGGRGLAGCWLAVAWMDSAGQKI